MNILVPIIFSILVRWFRSYTSFYSDIFITKEINPSFIFTILPLITDNIIIHLWNIRFWHHHSLAIGPPSILTLNLLGAIPLSKHSRSIASHCSLVMFFALSFTKCQSFVLSYSIRYSFSSDIVLK